MEGTSNHLPIKRIALICHVAVNFLLIMFWGQQLAFSPYLFGSIAEGKWQQQGRTKLLIQCFTAVQTTSDRSMTSTTGTTGAGKVAPLTQPSHLTIRRTSITAKCTKAVVNQRKAWID